MDNQFASWANRGLTLLGKILIYKTFGLSQIIYASRVLKFTKKEHAEIRNLIYKFLWNRDYQASKAPDRIKRDYLNVPINRGGFGMVDHELVVKAMNVKQVLVNVNGTHPIKEILKVLIPNRSSHFNSKMLEPVDGPAQNYCESLNEINQKILNRDRAYLEQDIIAKDMFLKEKVKDVARPERQSSLDLLILRNQGISTIEQLLNHPMANHYRMAVLHYKYSTIMDACMLGLPQDQLNEHFIPIKDKYKTANRITSKEIREELTPQNTIASFKLSPNDELITNAVRKINKLRSVKTKSFALRLIHGDIYTGSKLKKLGLSKTDECTKCRQTETLTHLIKDCWYSGLIWTKIYSLYRRTDSRRQTYDKDSLDFAIGSNLSAPKMKLHLEIIRRLTNKDRPNILPGRLLTQSLDYLIICDRDHHAFYKKLRESMQVTN